MNFVVDLLIRARRELSWAPPWVASLFLLGLCLAAALFLHFVAVRLAARAIRGRNTVWRPLLLRSRGPTRLAMILIALSFAAPLAPLTPGQVTVLRHLLMIGIIGLGGWLSLIGLDLATTVYMRRFRVDSPDSELARKHLTQVRILKRAAATMIVVLTTGLALMTINAVRQWGVSLLAAGGAAGIIVGLALQPLLSNLIAGIQIAMTQPIRIGDQVVVESQNGTIEEIKATYIVVRTWDWRRLVVPLSYFNQTPFENWTRECPSLIGVILLYLDYTTPLAALRARFEEVVRANAKWDGQVMSLQVTDMREQSMEVRCLVSARNSGEQFDLRCEVREALIAFLQAEHPTSLPRRRQTIDGSEQLLRDTRPGADAAAAGGRPEPRDREGSRH